MAAPPVTIDELVTPGYRDVLRRRYQREGWGASGYGWADVVGAHARQISARTILDYGCGRGTLAPLLRDEFDVREYDPGIEDKDALPEPADLVVCTDVLEHVEPDRLDSVLAHLRWLAARSLLVNVGLGRAREQLPDGRNAHLIQRPGAWWSRRLREAGLVPETERVRKGYFALIPTS